MSSYWLPIWRPRPRVEAGRKRAVIPKLCHSSERHSSCILGAFISRYVYTACALHSHRDNISSIHT